MRSHSYTEHQNITVTDLYMTWTFQQVDEYTNKVANFFHESGYRKGDVISLFMENRPEFFCFWLGLSKIGAVAALINFNLRQDPLAHCINVSESKALIFGGEMSEAVKDILPKLPATMRLFCSGRMVSNDLMPTHLDQLVSRASSYPPPPTEQSFRDRLFYVYTSGTTGLPKAAVVTHTRFFYMSFGITTMYGIRSSDIIYDTLPLYHTAGGVLGVGQVVHRGATVVIRRKFSASQFWTDCVKYNCTVGQYIGEICRYLLAQPFRPEEQQHRVRLMFGIAPFLYPVTLIKVDQRTGEPVRDKNGVCVQAQPGEIGELAGKIVKGNPVREFDGYVNKGATEKKILRDVFKKGDQAFMTGDMLLMDDLGYMYFHDRTGDTFRWRGENVSTSEVEAVVSNQVGLRDAVVYGVEVPGSEGRAGMAAIVDENQSLDLAGLTAALQRSLPPYARPVFIRLMKAVDTTGTFKLKKTDLRAEAFDPSKVRKDRLFYFSAKKGCYEPITPAVYADICGGTIRI
nr:hypothetical protein BaRGS_013262 [Batillaria attramentaria]